MNSLDFHLEEKLVIKLYDDENKYLIDLNKSKWSILHLDLNKSIYNWKFTVKWLKHNNKNIILDNNIFIRLEPFYPKCTNCNHLFIINLDNNRRNKIKIYDNNNNRLIISDILWYVIDK